MRKVLVSILMAAIAALGNIPYGYRFAHTLLPAVEPYSVIAGVVFASAATIANGMLGAYSLMNMLSKSFIELHKNLLTISFVGAIPMGFICFFGYRNIIPDVINIIVSCMVAIVNGAIGYVAIVGLAEAVKQLRLALIKNSFINLLLKAFGFLIGLCMSLVGYIAASNGIKLLFTKYGWTNSFSNYLIYIIAVLTWVPFAALYAESTRKVFGDILESSSKRYQLSARDVLVVIFALLSGTALTQIAVELFSPTHDIPEIFKNSNIQFFINYFLIPMTFVAVTAVNYLAINNFIKNVKKEK